MRTRSLDLFLQSKSYPLDLYKFSFLQIYEPMSYTWKARMTLIGGSWKYHPQHCKSVASQNLIKLMNFEVIDPMAWSDFNFKDSMGIVVCVTCFSRWKIRWSLAIEIGHIGWSSVTVSDFCRYGGGLPPGDWPSLSCWRNHHLQSFSGQQCYNVKGIMRPGCWAQCWYWMYLAKL